MITNVECGVIQRSDQPISGAASTFSSLWATGNNLTATILKRYEEAYRKRNAQRPPKDFGPTGHDYIESPDAGPVTADISEGEINELIAARLRAKMSRDFDEADRLQSELTDAGVYVHDGMKEWRADGVMFGDYANGDRPGRERGSRNDREKSFAQSPYSTGIDSLTADQVAKIDALVSRRAGAKLSRNYRTADNIRDELK